MEYKVPKKNLNSLPVLLLCWYPLFFRVHAVNLQTQTEAYTVTYNSIGNPELVISSPTHFFREYRMTASQ